MNSAFNDKQAGKGGRAMARQALRAALACALVLGGSGAALAQQHGERDYGGAAERHVERFRLPQMDRDPRQQEAPARGYDDPRRMQAYPQPYQQPYPSQYQPQPQDAQRHSSGRMTADERAEMRRQVNEAKDYYPQRR